jgi:hypothetical protein
MICYGTVADSAAGKTAPILETRERPASRLPVPRSPANFKEIVGWGAVYHLDAPAPGNDCGPRSFEILNPDPGEPGCVGVDLN